MLRAISWCDMNELLRLYEPAPQTLISNVYSWTISAPPLDLQPALPVVCTLGCWAEAMLGSWTRGWQSNAPCFGNEKRKKQISPKSNVSDKKMDVSEWEELTETMKGEYQKWLR